MKKLIDTFILAMLLMTGITSCADSNTVWDELPTEISEFISRYFPEQTVSRYVVDDNKSYVTVKNGPEIIFNTAGDWIAINGNGEIIPQMFLFDELPPALYSYLQENDAVKGVYKVTRTSLYYDLTLENTVIRYDVATGTITEPYSLE